MLLGLANEKIAGAAEIMETLEVEIIAAEDSYVNLETAKKVYDVIAEKSASISEASQVKAKVAEKVREIAIKEKEAVAVIDLIELTLDPEVFTEIDAGLLDIQVLEETAVVAAIAEEAVQLANAGGSEEADNIKVQFDFDQQNVESTTLVFVSMEKAETEAIENEKQAIIDEDIALKEFERLDEEEFEIEVIFAQAELDEEKAKEKVEDPTNNIADIPKYKQEYIDLTAQKEELRKIKDTTNKRREEAEKQWEENRIANEKAAELSEKMTELTEASKIASDNAKTQLATRTETMKEMLAEAKEQAWIIVGARKDVGGLAADLLIQSQLAYEDWVAPIDVLAKTFCGIYATYDSTVLITVTDFNDHHEQLQRDLVEARKGMDQAIILAKRLQTLTWNELSKAQNALANTVAEQQRLLEEKQRREEAERDQPVKCPSYTYAKEPETFENDDMIVTLTGLNKTVLDGFAVSSEQGLSVEECANLILNAEDAVCADKVNMKYVPTSGCYCFNPEGSATVSAADYEDFDGSHMFTI